jgi:hypothetical protein
MTLVVHGPVTDSDLDSLIAAAALLEDACS